MALISTTLSELAGALERESIVWVRLSAELVGDGWTLRLLEVTSGEAPPTWREIDWRYPEFMFGALAVEGVTAATWIRQKQITLEEIAFDAPFHDNLSRERRESGWGSNYFEPLRWPCDEWRLSRTDSPMGAQSGELVSDSAPSFRSPEMATALLLGVPYTGYNNASREFVVRQQDLRGRLASIRVDVAELTVSVEGDDLHDAVVELSSTAPGPIEQLDGSSIASVRFPLREGLPELAWIILRKRGALIDSRSLSWPTREARPGVEFVVAPEHRLEALVVSGESATTEFKERLPAQNANSRRKVMKTVAAFANGGGGTILFGVTNDGVIVGLHAEDDRREAADDLTRLVTSWVHPLPHFRVESIQHPQNDAIRVLALVVDAGGEPPYAAGTTPDDMTYYVRRSATTFSVMPDEVRALTLRAQPRAQYPFGQLP